MHNLNPLYVFLFYIAVENALLQQVLLLYIVQIQLMLTLSFNALIPFL